MISLQSQSIFFQEFISYQGQNSNIVADTVLIKWSCDQIHFTSNGTGWDHVPSDAMHWQDLNISKNAQPKSNQEKTYNEPKWKGSSKYLCCTL